MWSERDTYFPGMVRFSGNQASESPLVYREFPDVRSLTIGAILMAWGAGLRSTGPKQDRI